MTREELFKLIENLPEDKLADAYLSLQILSEQPAPQEILPKGEALKNIDRFLADLSGTLANVLYDLSREAEKKQEPILSKRLLFAMKKLKESWDDYQVREKKMF